MSSCYIGDVTVTCVCIIFGVGYIYSGRVHVCMEGQRNSICSRKRILELLIDIRNE
jgi:hypothetical protein